MYEILDVNLDFRKNIECVGELVESSLDGGITALASDSDSDFICSSDTSGTVGIWKVKSTKNIKFSYSLREKRRFAKYNLFKIRAFLAVCLDIGIYWHA